MRKISKLHSGKCFNKIIRPYRAVTRTIDFLVSFSLFIVLLTQFFLVLINTSIFIAQESELSENPAELLANRILGNKGRDSNGAVNWGIRKSIPKSFGLSSNFSTSKNFDVDLLKLARLNEELSISGLSASYDFIPADAVVSNLSQEFGEFVFRISTRPLLQIEIINPTIASLEVQVSTGLGKSLTNVDISAYLVNLGDGTTNPILSDVGITDIEGKSTLSILGEDVNINYLAVIFAYTGEYWGINWLEVQGASSPNGILAGGFSSVLMPYTNSKENFVQQYTEITQASTDTLYTSTMFYEPSSNTVNMSNSVSSAIDILHQNITQVGTVGPMIQVQLFDDGVNSHYRVVTSPIILNNFDYNTQLIERGFDKAIFPVYESPGFSERNFKNLHEYSLIVTSLKGPFIMIFEVGSF